MLEKLMSLNKVLDKFPNYYYAKIEGESIHFIDKNNKFENTKTLPIVLIDETQEGESKVTTITHEMKQYFGKEQEFEKIDNIHFTHVGPDGFYFHSDWFEK